MFEKVYFIEKATLLDTKNDEGIFCKNYSTAVKKFVELSDPDDRNHIENVLTSHSSMECFIFGEWSMYTVQCFQVYRAKGEAC